MVTYRSVDVVVEFVACGAVLVSSAVPALLHTWTEIGYYTL